MEFTMMCKKPAYYSEMFFKGAIKLMYVAILIHCIVATFMFSSKAVFGDPFNGNLTYHYLSHGFYYFFTGVLLLYVMWVYVLKHIVGRGLKLFGKMVLLKYMRRISLRRRQARIKDTPLFHEHKGKHDRTGLKLMTYSINDNPKYKHFNQAIQNK
jgi:hypothetical protein